MFKGQKGILGKDKISKSPRNVYFQKQYFFIPSYGCGANSNKKKVIPSFTLWSQFGFNSSSNLLEFFSLTFCKHI